MPLKTKLGKPTDQRIAMLRQQVTDLLTYGKLETTIDRAKATGIVSWLGQLYLILLGWGL